MNIAVILPSLKRSATITVALNITAGLVAIGHSVDIFYFDDVVDQSLPVGLNAYKIGFFKKVDLRKYDVVHSHNLRPDLYVAINRMHISGVCVSTIHNYVREELKNYHGTVLSIIVTRIWKWAWRRHDCLVCLTKHASEYYKRLLPRSNILFVYNGVSVSNAAHVELNEALIHAADSLKQNGLFVLGTYCNQIRRKGLEQIIRLLSRSESIGAIIIGEGPENASLVLLAKELGVESRCLFFPFLPFAYVYNKSFDVYIIPSRSEGFGISLVEAALIGVNIMCSDIPAFREMFSEFEVSFFDLDDTEGMLRIIDQIRSGLDKRSLAKQKAQCAFSVDAMARGYLQIYNQALGRLQ